MSATKDRLLEFLRFKGMGQQKFEISIGMSNGWVNKVGDSIRENTLKKISEVYPELNIAWLKSGVGVMLNPGYDIDLPVITANGSEILSKLLVYSGLNAKKFSEKIGFNRPQAIYDIQKGKTKNISIALADKIISVFPELDKAWLLTGEGDMVCKAAKDSVSREQKNVQATLSTGVNESSARQVSLLPVSAQGGSLNDFAASVNERDCEKVVSPIKDVDFAITVSGNSMAPEYPNGSHIFIKKINEKAFIEWGKVYVLDTCNGTVIKVLVPSDKEGYVRCRSINPDPAYAPFDVSLNDVYGVYRVLLCMSVK